MNLAKDWNGSAFPREAERVVLPDGRALGDAVIWPRFCQNELDFDPDAVWRSMLALPTWPSTRPIPFRERGDGPHWIDGTHPALHFRRSRDLKRSKIWFQSDYASGLRKYRYTGWRWAISFATHAIEFAPAVRRLTQKLNAGLVRSGHEPHNHWIVTRYDNEQDNIGFHRDKDQDFAANSYFVVIKFGAPRRFGFRLRGQQRPFHTRTLSAGTAIFVRCRAPGAANDLVEHGVPAMAAPVDVSGSLVSRCIKTVIPWDDVRCRVEQTQRRKNRGRQ